MTRFTISKIRLQKDDGLHLEALSSSILDPSLLRNTTCLVLRQSCGEAQASELGNNPPV